MRSRSSWPGRAVVAVALLAALPARAGGEEQPPQVEWVEGPAQVDVGSSIAELKLAEHLAFAKASDARKLLEAMGNPTDGSEVGLVVPKAKDENWFVIFEWDGVGYVKDEEKDSIDADALLESIREGTERANEERKKRGDTAIHVVGWSEKPHYDAATHNLSWAILGRADDGHEVVNYNVRVLGREGVMSVTLVDAPDKIAAAKPAVDAVLSDFTFKPGKRYAEWVPGDKVAQYGLTALVAAGAGAAAAKLGFFAMLGKLFAKGGKVIVAILAGLVAVLAKVWNALRGRASARPVPRGDAGPTT